MVSSQSFRPDCIKPKVSESAQLHPPLCSNDGTSSIPNPARIIINYQSSLTQVDDDDRYLGQKQLHGSRKATLCRTGNHLNSNTDRNVLTDDNNEEDWEMEVSTNHPNRPMHYIDGSPPVLLADIAGSLHTITSRRSAQRVPSSRGVQRTLSSRIVQRDISGMSNRSAHTNGTTSNASMMSGVSTFSDFSGLGRTGSVMSNISFMSDITDLSNSIEALRLDQDA